MNFLVKYQSYYAVCYLLKPDERPDFITICTVLKKEIDSIMEQQENE